MSALDDRIQRLVDAAIQQERKRTRAVIAEVIAELQARSGIDGDMLGKINDDIHELFNNRPDSRGIIRRQCFTPRPERNG
jgi:hypothetical protein